MNDPFVIVMVVLYVVGNVVNVCFAWFFWRLIKIFLRKVEPQLWAGSVPLQRQPTEEILGV